MIGINMLVWFNPFIKKLFTYEVNYLNFINTLTFNFDVIIIDGEFISSCCQYALQN